MATLSIRDEDRTLTDPKEIGDFLAPFGIWYRRFEGDELPSTATNEEILAAYKAPIDELMAEGGYVTADVINITPEIPGLDAMLAKFDKEHWHDEDEVRFIVKGSGLFHINPGDAGPVFSVEVVAGDMIKVPQGTHHWFHMCQSKTIQAIRLFQSKAGWTPHYTQSKVDARYIPMCFGPEFVPAAN